MLIAAGGYYGHDYWTVGRFHVSTDDAYVKADYTTVAPKVAGYVRQVLVNDNDVVKAGQVLARIDPNGAGSGDGAGNGASAASGESHAATSASSGVCSRGL